MSAALLLDRVTYRYPDAAAPALRDVDLRVEPGEFVVLAGGSGSGKSTLLRAASGLVPHFHGGEFAGRLESGGLDTRTHEPAQIAAVAGTLFQDPETQVVMGTVRAELAFPLENRGLGAAAVARGVEEAALALGIAPLLDRATHALSGGELQRVALGAALAGRPRVALLDEPTSQLDPVAGDELLGVLRRLNEEWGTAVILAEHRLERCLGAADRVIAMRDGAIACDADPRGFLEWAAEHAPELQTPGARLFSLAGRRPLPVYVKDARRTLAAGGAPVNRDDGSFGGGAPVIGDDGSAAGGAPVNREDGSFGGGAPVIGDDGSAAGAPVNREDGSFGGGRGLLARRRRSRVAPALAFSSVWLEHKGGAAVLRGVDLAVAPAERIALMGRNGAGKSTLLRVAAGLTDPTRGKVARAGRVALLLQNPGDYTLRDRVGDELPAAVLAAAGLDHLADRHPRDLSGGERQRLALTIVLHGERPAVVCLDEPTRGMDRRHKDALVALLQGLADAGTAVIVATHDAEFAAAFAARTVLLGDGRPVADAPTAEVLAGGWYFATQTARILGGAALLPEDGAALLRREVVVT
jgi:energy-coupling factor transporter ATP-binding protein EcfA2